MDSQRIVAHLIYDDTDAAVEWLTRTFAFRERSEWRHTVDGRIQRTQMYVDDSKFTLGRPSVHGTSPSHGSSSMLLIYVDDVDAHYRRSCDGGAEIVMPLEDRPWGDRSYQAADPEGRQWTFAQRVRDVTPEECCR